MYNNEAHFYVKWMSFFKNNTGQAVTLNSKQ